MLKNKGNLGNNGKGGKQKAMVQKELRHSWPKLPIDGYLDRLISLFQQNVGPLLLLESAPGTGKTTRFPLSVALDWQKRGEDKLIYVLVPRRAAAKLAATQAARLIGQKTGGLVGYQFRLERVGGRETRLWFLTEGTFLKILQQNPKLDNVGLVVIDEFHERHWQTDLALALLTHIRALSPTLGLAVMSATLETSSLKKYLSECFPALAVTHEKIPGTTYPLQSFYYPPRTVNNYAENFEQQVRRVFTQIGSQLGTWYLSAWYLSGENKSSNQDILFFLPGVGEIRRASDILSDMLAKGELPSDFVLTPLHSRLSSEEQERALYPLAGQRKIILSTNLAESSVTIEGVGYVVDSGLMRQVWFNPRTEVEVLQTKPIAQSSAIQRAGRAARTGPGVVVRLYSEQDFETRVAFLAPEVLQSNLSDGLLAILSFANHYNYQFSQFNWMTKPSEEQLSHYTKKYHVLNLVDASMTLTQAGKAVANLSEMSGLSLAQSYLLYKVGQRPSAEQTMLWPWMVAALVVLENHAEFARGRERSAISLDHAMEQLCTTLGRGIWRDSERTLRGLALDFMAGQSGLEWLKGQGQVMLQHRERVHATLAELLLELYPERVAKLSSLHRGQEKTASKKMGEKFFKSVAMASGDKAWMPEDEVNENKNRFGLLLALDEVEYSQGSKGRDLWCSLYLDIEEEQLIFHPTWAKESRQGLFDEKKLRVKTVERISFGALVLEEKLSEETYAPEAALELLNHLRGKHWPTSDMEESFLCRLQLLIDKKIVGHEWQTWLAPEAWPEAVAQAMADGHLQDFDSLVRASKEWGRLLPRPQHNFRPGGYWAEFYERTALEFLLCHLWAEGVQKKAPTLKLAREFKTYLLKDVPQILELAGGRKSEIVYKKGQPPYLQALVQDFFGMQEVPSILGGQEKLTIHLLTPARRPMAVTNDLASFWKNHYPKLRNEYSRRYPRHQWPLDPLHPADDGEEE